MANIILNNACNLYCPFCFASKHKKEKEGSSLLSLEEYDRLLSFISGNVRLCGGEPSLHPHFIQFLNTAISAERNIDIMTNGLWPDAVQKFFSDLPPHTHAYFTFLLNCLEPNLYKDDQLQCLQKTLSLLNPRKVTLGFTVYKPGFDPSYILSLAKRYGITSIRYSVTAPNIQGRGANLLPIVAYGPTAKVMSGLNREALKEGIELISDCGYIPPCCYEEKELLSLFLSPPPIRSAKFICSSPPDIGPNHTAWRCYGLYELLRADTKAFCTSAELTSHFNRHTRLLDNIHLFAECVGCSYKKEGICNGGCYAHRVKNLLEQAPGTNLNPIEDDELLLKSTPYIYREVAQVWKRPGGNYLQLYDEGPKRALAFDANAHAFICSVDGKTPLEELLLPWTQNASDSHAAALSILPSIRELFKMDIISIKPVWPEIELPSNKMVRTKREIE